VGGGSFSANVSDGDGGGFGLWRNEGFTGEVRATFFDVWFAQNRITATQICTVGNGGLSVRTGAAIWTHSSQAVPVEIGLADITLYDNTVDPQPNICPSGVCFDRTSGSAHQP